LPISRHCFKTKLYCILKWKKSELVLIEKCAPQILAAIFGQWKKEGVLLFKEQHKNVSQTWREFGRILVDKIGKYR
jgi:hypothetical protein